MRIRASFGSCAAQRAVRALALAGFSGPKQTGPFVPSQFTFARLGSRVSVVRITATAFGWIGSTTAFGAIVRKL